MASYVILALLLVHAVWGNPLAKPEIAKPRADDTDYRLPNTVIPLRYDLNIVPEFTEDTFDGNLIITINATEGGKIITLHAHKDLGILDENVELRSVDALIPIKPITRMEKEQFLQIQLNDDVLPLVANTTYKLHFKKFTGKLNSENDGFYLANFTDEKGNVKKFATTQFEATSARRAFPCFDEPAMKAIFSITITVPSDSYIAVSNTKGTSKGNVFTFGDTPQMSTYLVAFIVTEMQLSEPSGITQVLAKPQDIKDKKHTYGLTMGDQVLTKLGEYLNIPYDLSKMDQAAIPDEFFSAGAMENWGLVTYRETALLYSNVTNTASTKQSVSSVIGHEFGHQWFGNLVSPLWWEYIWLNEGFATYFGSAAVDMVDPSMELMQQFLIGAVHGALQIDSLNTSRPMNMDAGSPAEISSLFDNIVYDKAGSVIRMMEGFLTAPIFKAGLTTYLRAMKNNAATPDDLYTSIQKVVNATIIPVLPKNLTVKNVMESWDNVVGYPVVNVTRYYDTETDEVHFTQERFLLNISKLEKPVEGKWKIPINFVSANYPSFNTTSPTEWLVEPSQNFTVPYVSDTDWIIVNKKQTGFYRVNYDIANWHLIHHGLIDDHSRIDVLNRAQIIDDSFNLARSGRLDYEIGMMIGTYLKNERNYIAFQPFYNAISFLETKLYYSPTHEQFRSYVRLVLENIYQHLGFEPQKPTEGEDAPIDKHTDIINRAKVLNWMCRMGHTDCRTKSLEKFTGWKNDNTEIPINIKSEVLCGAMRTGSEEDYTFLLNKLNVTKENRELRTWYLSALGCSENTEIIKQYLQASLNKTNTFKPDEVMRAVYNGGDIGLQESLNFLEAHFTEIQTNVTNMDTIIKGIGTLISTQTQFEQFNNISVKNPLPIFVETLKVAKENVDWGNANRDGISLALSKAGISEETGGSLSNAGVNVMLLIVSYLIAAMLH